jgi:hypothetical protein
MDLWLSHSQTLSRKDRNAQLDSCCQLPLAGILSTLGGTHLRHRRPPGTTMMLLSSAERNSKICLKPLLAAMPAGSGWVHWQTCNSNRAPARRAAQQGRVHTAPRCMHVSSTTGAKQLCSVALCLAPEASTSYTVTPACRGRGAGAGSAQKLHPAGCHAAEPVPQLAAIAHMHASQPAHMHANQPAQDLRHRRLPAPPLSHLHSQRCMFTFDWCPQRDGQPEAYLVGQTSLLVVFCTVLVHATQTKGQRHMQQRATCTGAADARATSFHVPLDRLAHARGSKWLTVVSPL